MVRPRNTNLQMRIIRPFSSLVYLSSLYTEKNGFVTATKLGTTNNFFVAATKYFAAATKLFVDRTKQLVVTKYYFIPTLTNDFVGITKPFIGLNLELVMRKTNSVWE